MEELEPGLSTCPMDLGTLRHRLGTDKNGNDMLELALTETPDVLDGATEQDTMKFAFTKRINLESGAVTDVFPRAEVTFVSGTFGTHTEVLSDDSYSMENPEKRANEKHIREERVVEDATPRERGGGMKEETAATGPCMDISAEDDRCCTLLDLDEQELCCAKKGGCQSRNERQAKVREFAVEEEQQQTRVEEAKGREKDEIVRQEQILVDELVEVRQALLLTEVNPEREAAKKVELRERGDELDLQVTERDTKQNERDELAADVITLRSEIALETDPVIKADKEVARVAKETRVREVESELVSVFENFCF